MALFHKAPSATIHHNYIAPCSWSLNAKDIRILAEDFIRMKNEGWYWDPWVVGGEGWVYGAFIELLGNLGPTNQTAWLHFLHIYYRVHIETNTKPNNSLISILFGYFFSIKKVSFAILCQEWWLLETEFLQSITCK